MKKRFTVAFILCVLLLLAACEVSEGGMGLMCDENGNFTVLVVSDPQCDKEEQWEEARAERCGL